MPATHRACSRGSTTAGGGKTGTALYRIRGTLSLQQPILHDNGKANLALRRDAQTLAGELPEVCGGIPDIVYIDPPYNQHPYGSNYHVLNTIALWDKPPISPGILVDGRKRDKSAIRTDWRTLRRSPYNSARDALPAFRALLDRVQARWILVSYSTDGNIPLEGLLAALAERGQVHVFAQKYKRYRVSTPRMSPRPHNVEFVAVLETSGPSCPARVGEMADAIHRREGQPLAT
jgi:adenine-specific DNA-methyltransferase